MDYEKEYNEVFKRAKELHEGGNALTKKQMEIVFPSLADEWDGHTPQEAAERIKKYLQNEQSEMELTTAVRNITKDKESAIKFLKSAGIMDENGELAEIYRS